MLIIIIIYLIYKFIYLLFGLKKKIKPSLNKMPIIYGSQSGSVRHFAKHLADKLHTKGYKQFDIVNPGSFDDEVFRKIKQKDF